MVHVSETCEPTAPHLLTQVHTTTAAVHEAMCTAEIHQALVDKDLAPGEHWSTRPTLTPTCSCAVRPTTASRCAAQRARIPPGKPKSPGRIR